MVTLIGILLFSHGSHHPDQQKQMDAIQKKVSSRFPNCVIKSASLIQGKEAIFSILEKMNHLGAERILLIPCFLFDGIHTQQSIPQLIQLFRSSYPSVPIKICDILGTDPQMIDIISNQITKNISY